MLRIARSLLIHHVTRTAFVMKSEIDYPRVLVLGSNFGLLTGGGITLTNLFQRWPTERLAVASPVRRELDPAPCGYQYLLGEAEIEWLRPLRLARSLHSQQHLRSGPAIVLPPPGDVFSARRAAYTRLRPLAEAVFQASARCLGSDDYLRRQTLSQQLLSWSASFHPTLLYTQLASIGMIRLTLQLANALRVPIAVHMMDDWPAVIYGHGLLRRQLRARTDLGLRTIIDSATARLAISDAMAIEYAARYGQHWDVFHNPADLPRWSKTRRSSWHLSDGFRLVYSGRIGPGIDSSLLDVSRAVASLQRQGRRLSFDIHSPHFDDTDDRRFSGFQGVATHGVIADSEMPATLAKADTLVLPFDFHGEAAAFARLSFPTKAPGYMATGTPVLVYAPRSHAVAADASGRGWGYVVSDPSVRALADAISLLMDDEALRSSLGRRALKEVEQRYNADIVRTRFATALAAAARHRNESFRA